MMSQRLSASMLWASCSVVSFFAMAGAAPPAFEVEKNRGSIRSKSFSSTMRSINTEPTMPRQPTKPTNLLISTPFQFKNSPDQAVCPGSSGRGGAHDDAGAGSALNNGRGCGDGCARSHASFGGGLGVQGEQVGGKHLGIVIASALWLADT